MPSVTTATVFCLIVRFQTLRGVVGDRPADAGDARRVGHREVVARLQRRFGAISILPPRWMQERAVGDVLDLDAVDRADGRDDPVDVLLVGREHGHVADLRAVLDADEVDRAERAAGVADRRREPGERSRAGRRGARGASR